MTYNALLATNDDGSPLELSYEQRADHTYIVGITGKGKSTLMAHMALADMTTPTVLDSVFWTLTARSWKTS